MTVLEQIEQIKSASADVIPDILASISVLIQKKPIDEKEAQKLRDLILDLISSSPPAILRASISMCEKIFEQNLSNEDFLIKILDNLKIPMVSTNKQIREASYSMVKSILTDVMTTRKDVFWDIFKNVFNDNSPYLKSSGLDLLLITLNEDTEFKTGRFIRSVFKLLDDKNTKIRDKAFAIAGLLYSRNANTVEKLIKEQFSFKANSILATIEKTNQSSSTSEKNTVVSMSFSTASSIQFQTTSDEMENNLRLEFDYPFISKLKPRPGQCPFEIIKKGLGRNIDWEKRIEHLNTIIQYAKKAPKAITFVKGLQTIQDEFVSCLTDSRSALTKHACLCLVSLAQILNNALDLCSDWIIPKVLNRTSNGTRIIALSSELAVINYVKFVSGPKTKKLLEDSAESQSIDVRMTTIKCLMMALESWSPEMSKSFGDILIAKKHDQSDKVRNLVANYEKQSIETPISFEEIINDDEMDINDTDLIEEAHLQDESLKGLINVKSIEGIHHFIENNKCGILGFVEPIVAIMCEGFRKDKDMKNSSHLFTCLCKNFSNQLHPFISVITQNIPDDKCYGKMVISTLSSTFGENSVARLLMNSSNVQACEFTLRFAHKLENNLNFSCKAIFQTLSNNHYEELHELVIRLVKQVYSCNAIKCEALLASLHQKVRDEILCDIKEVIPNLYSVFSVNENDLLSDQLFKELNRIKTSMSNEEIDFSLIEKAQKSGTSSCIILAITILREQSLTLTKNSISFLMSCLSNTDGVIQSAATIALVKHVENGTLNLQDFIDCFGIPTSGAFKVLEAFLKKKKETRSTTNNDDQIMIEDIIKAKIIEGIQDFHSKYAVLSVIAYIYTAFGINYHTLCGELTNVNQRILETMLNSH